MQRLSEKTQFPVLLTYSHTLYSCAAADSISTDIAQAVSLQQLSLLFWFVAEEGEEKLSLEADNKVFFFDVGENQYGDYLRISEVFLVHRIM